MYTRSFVVNDMRLIDGYAMLDWALDGEKLPDFPTMLFKKKNYYLIYSRSF